MAISNASYLKNFYDTSRALGAKVISSDFSFEIEGFEDRYLLCKQAPWPELSSAGEIEIAGALGTNYWQPQQIKIAQQGPIAMIETVAGHVDQLMLALIARKGLFNAKIYEGTPQKYLRYKRIVDCFIQADTPDRNWENRSQPLVISGTLFYHYFGEMIQGNSADYD